MWWVLPADLNFFSNILSEGKILKIHENETKIRIEEYAEEIFKASEYNLQFPGVQPASVIIYCIAEIKLLNWKRSSDLLEVLITCNYMLLLYLLVFPVIPAPPQYLQIAGPDIIAREEEAEYSCAVEGGYL